jgi:hypothetical protein
MYQYQPYVCLSARDRFGGVDFDCFKGTEARFGVLQPDLYCSGTPTSPACSDKWYPEALAKYNLVNLNGGTYVCTASSTSVGDQNCAGYEGGDPATANGPVLRCSPVNGQLSCLPNYFPSELNGLTIVKLDGQQYVCKQGFGKAACYKWDGYSSPKAATYGFASLYCDSSGICTKAGY